MGKRSWRRGRSRAVKAGEKQQENGSTDEASNSNSRRMEKCEAEARVKAKRQRDASYTPAVLSNAKMETYYALQGLHNLHYSETEWKECTTDAEREEERSRWMASLRRILPASFRIGQDVDADLRARIVEELQTFVGQPMDLMVFVDDDGGNGNDKHDDEDDDKDDDGKEEEEATDVLDGSIRLAPERQKAQQMVRPANFRKSSQQWKQQTQASKKATETETETTSTSTGSTTTDGNAEKDTEEDVAMDVDAKESQEEKSTEAKDDKEKGNAAAASNDVSSASTDQKRRDRASAPPVSLRVTTKKVAPARSIPFIPYAYQLSVDRRTIRRNPSLEKFHQWLKIQTDAGFITRQETVSMIPPIVLGVEPHHVVLDTCAAPGSKTSQLLEIVASSFSSPSGEPEGLVVANDDDAKRAYMLVHQLKRLNSPATFVSAADAQFFPLPKSFAKTPTEGLFDRVLCDVPCTGDGTTRKNPGVWRFWNQASALALHPLQLSITLNGARLTKVGGYLCYSTCSMNPVENEAVVAAVLRHAEGSLELVDRRPQMPGLQARPGWSFWKVLTEEKSRSEERNYQKKNNAKMKARRREWQAKRQREEAKAQEGPKGEVHQKEANEKGEENGTGEMATEDAVAPDKETEMDIAKDENGTSTKDEDATKDKDTATDGQANAGTNDKDDPADAATKPPKKTLLPPPPAWDEATLRQRALDAGLVLLETYDEVPEAWRRRVRPSVFPPTAEEAQEFHLERCLRCLPHDMDTGGFFVALFRKVHPMSTRARRLAEDLAQEVRDAAAGKGSGQATKKQETLAEEQNKEEEEDDGDDNDAPQTKRARMVQGGEGKEASTTEPESVPNGTAAVEDSNKAETAATPVAMETTPTSNDDAEKKENDNDNDDESHNDEKKSSSVENPDAKVAKGKPLLRGRGKTRGTVGNDNYLPVDSSLWPPLVEFYGLSDSFPRSQVYTRSQAEQSPKVLYFLTRTVQRLLIDSGIQDRVTVISSGLKLLERTNKECAVDFRVTQEAVQYVAPHMTKRLIVTSAADYAKCIALGGLPLSTFSDQFANAVRPLSMGTFVVALQGYQQNVAQKMYLVMWKCRGDAINCLVAKMEMDGMKSKLKALTSLREECSDDKTTRETRMDEQDGSTNSSGMMATSNPT